MNATLLFTDMCGFTEFSKTREPKEVVRVLSELFTKFDNMCIKHNVYKVHTIGDCYVIMGYTGKVAAENRNPFAEAINVIEAGFEMIEIIRSVRHEIGINTLDMRIGIHTVSKLSQVLGYGDCWNHWVQYSTL